MKNKIEGGSCFLEQLKQNKTGMPLITVIISTYNAAAFLQVTIESIKSQFYNNIETIIIDGASSDGTLDILRANDNVITYWLSEPDLGIYDAWNKALSKVHGEWILFLGAGDILKKGWPESIIKYGKGFDLVYGDLELIGNIHDKHKTLRLKSRPWNTTRLDLPTKMSLPHVGMAHHYSLFTKNTFDKSYKIIGDWDFLTRVLPKRGYYCAGSVQAQMIFGGKSKDACSVSDQYQEIRRSLRARNILMPINVRIKWLLKRWLSLFPPLYSWLQFRYWKTKSLPSLNHLKSHGTEG